jgi:deoxyribodipyrimidine photo-lyase
MIALHWFRRDLRLTDNSALSAAVKAHPGRIVPVYILSSWKSSHRWTGPARQSFLCDCLKSLAEDLTEIGGRLIVRQGCAVEELERLVEETHAEAIYFNRDPDPFGRAMEVRVETMAKRRGVTIHSFKDVAIHERDEILTNAGEHYRVFTPYSRAWLKAPKPEVKAKIGQITTPKALQSLPLPSPATWDLSFPEHRFKAGERAANDRFHAFLSGPISFYAERRDFPAGNNNSRLSADLRFGTISVRQIHAQCLKATESASMQERQSIATFLNELIWREFYMQILWKWPEVLELEFNPKFRAMKWRQPAEKGQEERFERWCNGQTGFPIVDAAMRELNSTGYMHNRLRMIVAMFLTKDLHLDWRHGECYFMQRLVDGDIAANNGGWQWSAGSGADATPYFRIQNPWTQTSRFDPHGEFIHQWVPELGAVPAGKFLTPPPPGIPLAKGYPLPMLDHARERIAALEMMP